MRNKLEHKTIQVSTPVWRKIKRYAGPGKTMRITDWVEACLLAEILKQATLEQAARNFDKEDNTNA